MFKHIYLFVFIIGSFLFGQNDYEKWLKEQEAELIEMARAVPHQFHNKIYQHYSN
jgi:ribosomal protein L30E